MGINADIATSAEEAEQVMKDQEEKIQEIPKPAPPKQPEPEPVQEESLTEEERAKKKARMESDAQKDLGNYAYKKRNFDEALGHYAKAWELDSTNVAVLTNKAACLFEMEKYTESIEACQEAIDVGRSVFADYKLIARAFARIGNAHVKLDNLELAIKSFEKSLSEHRNPETLNRLREIEKLKKIQDKEAYKDPVLSDKSREEGNVFFKNHDYASAIQCYTEAIKRNDQDAKNYTNRAACYVKLLALSEADKDCDEALKLDPNFVKGYVRKASVLLAKRDFMKAMQWCRDAKEKDVEGKSSNEIDQLVVSFKVKILTL